MGVCVYIRRLLGGITVEPLVLAAMTAIYFLVQGRQQFFFFKLCMINYNDLEACYNLSGNPHWEEQVQIDTARWMMYTDIALLVPTLCSSLVLAAWSDRSGRKPALIIGCLGGVIFGTVWLVCSVWIQIPMPFLLIGSLGLGASGGQVIIMATAVSYIADITTTEERVKRVGLADGALFIASVISLFSSGLLLDAHLYSLLFTLMIVLFLCGILYTLVCLNETRPLESENSAVQETDPLLGGCGEPNDGGDLAHAPRDHDGGVGGFCSACCSVDLVLRSFVVAVRKRPGRRRLVIILVMVAFLVNQVAFVGFQNVFVLYASKAPFKWSPLMIGSLIGVIAIANAIALLVFLPCLRWAHVNNNVIVILVLLSISISCGLFSIARTTTAIWLAAMPTFVFGLVPAIYKGLTTMLVPGDETGSVVALLMNMDAIATLCAALIFDNLYPATLHILNGTVSFLTASGLFFLELCVFLVVAYSSKYHSGNEDSGSIDEATT
ncbi:proton-coupled folate transporter-like [Asterias amurensis]|uniref:proton-coupled folate transporter-like n=1 Tax=Asterias amurensis TaxID=7602 RepID=UPI003AB72189